MKTIENRQKLALMYRTKEKIEDYQDDVFEIIDNKGLKSENDKTSLDSAFKVLEYIIPKKKQSEVIIKDKTIEDIIRDEIPEAEYTEIDENEATGGDLRQDNSQEHSQQSSTNKNNEAK